MDHGDLTTLRAIRENIDRIEEYAQQLKTLGEGVPAVETNARCILTSVYLLKFGISDIVGIHEAER